jgi:ABC-type transport system substrate-binding protein
MPAITDGGRTFTIKVKPGIFFADDPAFKGKPHELTADDYAFSVKRIFDPRVRSPSLFIFEHQLAGLDEALATARRT